MFTRCQQTTHKMSDKKRSANFSEQECVLLMDLLGEDSDFNPNLTRFQFIKHKFTTGITSISKREQWLLIHEKFVASSGTFRTVDELEKKTNNLIQKHRNIYSDYIRNINQTGGGPRTPTLSFLTEAVMAVIGKESMNVAGVCLPIQTDSTMMAMANRRNVCDGPAEDEVEVVQEEEIPQKGIQIPCSSERSTPKRPCSSERSTPKRPNTCFQHCSICCISQQEVHQLKKKKLMVEIKLLEKNCKRNDSYSETRIN